MAPDRVAPYRDPPSRVQPPQRRPSGPLGRDVVVVLVLFAVLASIARWSDVIDAVSAAMGFPRAR